MVPSPAGSMGKDRIRMTRDKYILHGHWALDGFMSDLKRPWLSEKGTKMSCSFMQKLSVLTRQEARVTAPANQKPGS